MKEKHQRDRSVIFYVRRFDPERDEFPRTQAYTIDVERGMTVLDGLHRIKATQDPTLVWRYSCRMGVCGSCAMLINEKPALACNTQILDVANRALTLAPLPNFDIIKDLVPDFTPLFKKHAQTQPYIQRGDLESMPEPTREFFQSPRQLEKYLQFAYCIKCGACMAACPTVATDHEYLGPMPLAQAHRYNEDSRDGGFEARKKSVAVPHAVFSCHYAGECSNVCPKGVDPARAIQRMKRALVLDYLKLRKKKRPAQVLSLSEATKHKPPIAPPRYTVNRQGEKAARHKS